MQYQTLENVLIFLNSVFLIFTLIFYFIISASLLSKSWSVLPNSTLKFSSILQTVFLVLRCFHSGHFPLSNLYESLLFLSWVLTTLLIFLNQRFQTFPSQSNDSVFYEKFNLSSTTFPTFLGSLLTPFILLVNTFATLSLPSELKATSSLVPALKSNWLMMHVTFMILSYGALLCGCLLSIAFLVLSFFSKTEKLTFGFFNTTKAEKPNEKKVNFSLQTNALASTFEGHVQTENFIQASNQLTENLDNLSYRIIGFGFPLLTIGILSGAVWANQTWGSYWSWDPKETWALITWLIFAIYLHTRISHQWTGRQSAWIASFGFLIIWVCYLGVNLLGKGLHSYGFFQ